MYTTYYNKYLICFPARTITFRRRINIRNDVLTNTDVYLLNLSLNKVKVCQPFHLSGVFRSIITPHFFLRLQIYIFIVQLIHFRM